MDIVLYSTQTCPICEKTQTLLNKWQLPFIVKKVDQDRQALIEMSELTNHARTVPQISIDGKWIGGFSELTELHMDGFFD